MVGKHEIFAGSQECDSLLFACIILRQYGGRTSTVEGFLLFIQSSVGIQFSSFLWFSLILLCRAWSRSESCMGRRRCTSAQLMILASSSAECSNFVIVAMPVVVVPPEERTHSGHLVQLMYHHLPNEGSLIVPEVYLVW